MHYMLIIREASRIFAGFDLIKEQSCGFGDSESFWKDVIGLLILFRLSA